MKLNINNSYDDDNIFESDYEMDDVEYSPSPSPSPIAMTSTMATTTTTTRSISPPQINLFTNKRNVKLPTNNRNSRCCEHDPYLNIMEICHFCNKEICHLCRIQMNGDDYNNKKVIKQNKNPSIDKISKLHTEHIDDDDDLYCYNNNDIFCNFGDDDGSGSESELELGPVVPITIIPKCNKFEMESEEEMDKYQCKSCTIKNELESMCYIILNALNKSKLINIKQDKFEMHIIEIISSYSVGYIFKCCNINQKCDTEISINNRFDLENTDNTQCMVDSDNNKILNVLYCNNNNNNHNDNKLCIKQNKHNKHNEDKNEYNYNHNNSNNKSKEREKSQYKISKKTTADYVEIHGQKRKIFCADCNQKNRSLLHPTSITPFMMLMATKRFKKNQFGVYE